MKNKSVVAAIDNRRPVGLRLKICKAVGIDSPRLHPRVLNRQYGMAYWVDPDDVFCTRVTEGWPDPFWLEKNTIFLGHNPEDFAFLNLEIVRFNSMVDPGSSSGTMVVGRARIPLPKELHSEKTGYFGLVRAEEEGHKPEGHILLSMKLKRIKVTNPASRHICESFR